MFLNAEGVLRAVDRQFGRGRVLVVGDLMLDAYLWGDVGRISPEAPVPIVRISRRTETPGGAGNVLLNLVGLGLQPLAAGFVGDDETGRRLRELLGGAGIDTRAIVNWEGRPTITKTRVIGGHQQMIRLDEETPGPASEADLARLLAAVDTVLDDQISGIILSDYSKGVLPAQVCRHLITEARQRGIPVFVDPKGRDFRKYTGATTLTPNRHEMETAVGLDHAEDGLMNEAGRKLAEDLNLSYLVVTRGEAGIRLFDDRGVHDFAATAREVFDVSGAGDTVIATLTASLVAGLDLDDALRLANLAAGVVVGKIGTVPIQRPELLETLHAVQVVERSDKISTVEALQRKTAEWKARGEQVVFTNGCFDLLHVGHVTLLAKAKREGHRLIVGLNTDRSVRELKGPTRPVVVQEDRAQVLAGLSSVDAVVLFDEETPYELIEALKPDVLVKGGDYEESQIVGADLVKSWGGRVVIVNLVEGRSTTKMIARSRPEA